MYRHYEKSPQIFTIPIDKDTIIECKEVTTLRIPANSFMIESSGEAVNGDVEISVKEYYDLSDMILANLSTMSGDKILETGGMIHISANSHGENCILKKDREIKIGFPYFSEKKDMQLFSGDWKNNNIDWTPMIPSDDTNKSTPQETDQPELEIFTVVEAMPSFPGGNKSFDAYMSQNLKYPFSALEDKSEGTVYVTFVVDEFGFITNPRVLRGVNRALDKAAVYVISKMPQWIPGTQRSIPVPVQFNMPVTFSLDKINLTEKAILEAKEFEEKIEDVSVVYNVNGFSTDDSVYQEEFERQVEEEGFQSTGVSQLNRYLFSTSQLGWINCDIFFRDNRPKINYIVETNNTEETFVKVIFHSVKSILYGLPSGNNYFFRKVPEGEKITIVAFRNANEQLLLAVKESVVSKNGEINLDFQPITLDLLKMEMEKINSIN
jgi:TonB family protein